LSTAPAAALLQFSCPALPEPDGLTNIQSILGCGLHHVGAGSRHIAPLTIKLNHSVSQTTRHH
jgi:hypothetical protein